MKVTTASYQREREKRERERREREKRERERGERERRERGERERRERERGEREERERRARERETIYNSLAVHRSLTKYVSLYSIPLLNITTFNISVKWLGWFLTL